MSDGLRVGWRREELPQPELAEEPRLIEAIRAELSARGPIPFARFMQRALYEPDLGYYATSVERTTRSGDFLTAPELHPVFGQTLALIVDEMWHCLGLPAPFTLREYGAGSGALFLALLDGLKSAASGLAEQIRYQPLDLGLQSSLIGARLVAAGHERLLSHAIDGDAITGLILANEFVDALPVHRVVQQGGELRELYVEWRDGRFVEAPGDLSDERLADWFRDEGVTLADGQSAEVNLAMLDWLDEVASSLALGYVLVIDYGAGSDELYSAKRATGTLRAFSGHQVSADVLGGVGRRDITAHVNFDVIESHARAAGLAVLGRRRAAEFLIAAGLDEVYAAARGAADSDWASALELRAAIRRLLDPRALGGYTVSILGKGVETKPALKALADAR